MLALDELGGLSDSVIGGAGGAAPYPPFVSGPVEGIALSRTRFLLSFLTLKSSSFPIFIIIQGEEALSPTLLQDCVRKQAGQKVSLTRTASCWGL